MKFKEIISHHLYEDMETMDVEVLFENDAEETTKWLEIEINDLDDEIELFEDREWTDYDENDTLTMIGEIDPEKLHQALESYFENNPDITKV